MIFDNLPKVNIALGTVVLVCFFLPWISIDCGNMTFVKVSGLQLTTGNIPLDEARMEELSNQFGRRMALDESGDEVSQSTQTEPRFYFLAILVCAGTLIFYSYRMMSQLTRVEILGALIPGGIGALSMLFFLASDFGIDMPADAAVIIQVTPQFGFYGTLLAFIGVTTLSAMSLRAFEPPEKPQAAAAQPGPRFVPAEPVILDPDPKQDGNVEILIDETPLEKALDLPQVYEPPKEQKPAQTPAKPAPPGAKACPSCGAVVGIYQTMCMKCKSPLKPNKK